MNERRLSDTDIEALVAGRPVDGAPSQLNGLLSTMRNTADTGRSVPISAALSEFIVDGTSSTTPANAETVPASPRWSRPIATRVAAVLTIVPAKILIGATMAAAALGGAQALGVVDVPLLPGPGPEIEIPAPAFVPVTVTVAPEIPIQPERTVPTTSSENSVAPADTKKTVPAAPSTAPGAAQPTLPAQAAVEGTPGCQLGQDSSARPSNTPNSADRADQADRAVVPEIDPCAAAATPSTGTTPSGPVDPARPNDAGNAGHAGTPASTPGTKQTSPSSSAPEQAAGQSNSGGGNAPVSTPAEEIGPGRTPPGG